MDTYRNEAKAPTIMFTIMFNYVHDYKLCVTLIITGHWLFKGGIHSHIIKEKENLFCAFFDKPHRRHKIYTEWREFTNLNGL